MKTIVTLLSILVAFSQYAYAELRDDINADNRIGLAEAIHALQNTTESQSKLTEAIFALQVTIGMDSVHLTGTAELGPLSGAEIYFSQLDGTPIANGVAYVSDDLEIAGKFSTVTRHSNLPEYFIVSAYGGVDIDPDNDGIKDEGIQNEGVIHAIVPKSVALVDSFGVNPITEMIYQSIMLEYPDGVAELTTSELTVLLNSKCALLLNNSTGYADALSFVPYLHKLNSKIPWATILNKLIVPIREGQSSGNISSRVALLSAELKETGLTESVDGTTFEKIEDIGSDRIQTQVTGNNQNQVILVDQQYVDGSGAIVAVRVERMNNEQSYLHIIISKKGNTLEIEGATSILQNITFSEADIAAIVSKLIEIHDVNDGSFNITIDKSLVAQISDKEIVFKVNGHEPSPEDLAVILDDPLFYWKWDSTLLTAQSIAHAINLDIDGHEIDEFWQLDDGTYILRMPNYELDQISGLGADRENSFWKGLKSGVVDILGAFVGPGLSIIANTISGTADGVWYLEVLPIIAESSLTSTRVDIFGPKETGKAVIGERYRPIIYVRNKSSDGTLLSVFLEMSYITYASNSAGSSDYTPHFSNKKIAEFNVENGCGHTNSKCGYIIIPPDSVTFLSSQAGDINYVGGVPYINIQAETNVSDLSRNTRVEFSETVTTYTDFNYIVDGNIVNVDASPSMSSDGTITSYSWRHNGVEIATGKMTTIAQSLIFDGNRCFLHNRNPQSCNQEFPTIAKWNSPILQ